MLRGRDRVVDSITVAADRFAASWIRAIIRLSHAPEGVTVLSDYTNAAMRHAEYEVLEDNEGWFGHIPQLPGVWASSA